MLSVGNSAPKLIGGYQSQNTNTPVSQDLSKLAVNSLGARAQTTLLGIQLDFDVYLYDLFSPRKWSYGLAYKPTGE